MLTWHKKTDPFYKLPAWKRLREACLQRDHYICQDCLEYGTVTIANTVHHIKERLLYPQLALDLSNLVSLCSACHNRRHGNDGRPRELTTVPNGVRIIKA